MRALDHLAVVCADLDPGASWVEDVLGVPLSPGGQHALFGTHNRLLGLGEGLYLEVIAPDPGAPPPGRPRWFGLDAAPAAPRLGNWIVRTDNLADRPEGAGEVLALTRGALSWQITVPPDGSLCDGGAFPTLIHWGDGVTHPSSGLPDRGVRLTRLDVHHPDPADLRARLAPLDDPRVVLVAAPVVALRALFDTPAGPRWLV